MSQDNRIPSIIRDFTGKPAIRSILSFLAFEDWLAKEETKSSDWIIVARSWREGTTDLFTFSALASATKDNLDRLLSKSDWDVGLEFGKPSFYSYGGEKVAHYDPGLDTEIDGIKFRPFVIYREFHGFVTSTFELVQNFILYHEAFLVTEKSEYQRIDDEGDIHTIVRIKQEDNNRLVLIDAHHLKDYLSANQCYLVRYHDHRRRAVEDISEHIKGQFESYTLGDKSSRFELWLRTDIPWNGYKSASRLLGKDVVFPYSEPDKRHTWFATGEREEKFATFIIGRDEQGKDVESTCNENELSNYFTDRGTPHFLTPVFFKREVLVKYYQEPSRYRVSNVGVECLDLWHLPIDITEEELVQVWLGDLGRIPYKEQLHWRQFNVTPRGTITRHRWLRDFMAEFANPADDPVYYFRVAFEETQREAKAKYGEALFQGLDDKDRHAYETLHLPLTEEWKEFDEQVQALAKITVDSLNVNLLSRESGQKIDGSSIKGSIDLLGVYLSGMEVKENIKEEIIHALHAVQTIRSTGTAHRKGSNFNKTLQRFQLDNLSNREKVKKLIKDLTRALSLMAEAMRQIETSEG
ncbi:MAG: hypothetical protein KBG04_06710 [Bacteroidales bacterium]|jgi:CRISPR/Cas system-associated exonuclease Cas4 (RecB family)|nr:hypothetical protein [Bacteroidales bacterium]